MLGIMSISTVNTVLPCPRCRAPLDLAQQRANPDAPGAHLHGCRSCGGVWLDATTSFNVARTLDPRLDHALISLAEGLGGATTAPADDAAPLSCPICARSMEKRWVGAAAVELDRCEDGTWFDRSELAKVCAALEVAKAPAAPEEAAPAHGTPAPGGESAFATVANGAVFVVDLLQLIAVFA
jgi:Zn-finger nucleic acid-binding protein